jgi:hypothetical protein
MLRLANNQINKCERLNLGVIIIKSFLILQPLATCLAKAAKKALPLVK